MYQLRNDLTNYICKDTRVNVAYVDDRKMIFAVCRENHPERGLVNVTIKRDVDGDTSIKVHLEFSCTLDDQFLSSSVHGLLDEIESLIE